MTYTLLILSVVAAALTVVWLKPSDPNKLKLLIAFSGAYLLSITALHMLPEVFLGDDRGAYFGAFVLLGFFIQVMLEFLSGGIEHGHAHTHRHGVLPVGLMFGLCLHAFLEGMPLGGGDTGHSHHGHSHHGHSHSHEHSHGLQPLLLGIVLHKYPVAMVFLAMLLNSGMGRPKAFGLLAVFAAMAPLGTLLSGVEVVGQFHRESLAIVIGIFLHVSTTILFESSEGHRFNAYKMMAIAAGLALAGAGMLLIHH